jgi:hypothetical protein
MNPLVPCPSTPNPERAVFFAVPVPTRGRLLSRQPCRPPMPSLFVAAAAAYLDRSVMRIACSWLVRCQPLQRRQGYLRRSAQRVVVRSSAAA